VRARCQTLRSRFDRDAGPPCGHPASNGCALDGASPASGRSATTLGLTREVGESAGALSATGRFAESHPLTLLPGDRDRPAGASQEPNRVSPFRSEHVNASDLPELEAPSTEERPGTRGLTLGRAQVLDPVLPRGAGPCAARMPFRAPMRSAAAAGQRGTGAARVHRRSRTSTRPLSARCSRTSSRPRALLRFLQVDVSTSTTMDRSNIPSRGSGRDDCLVRSKVAFRPGSRRRYAGSGAEDNRASTLPIVIAHDGDFAPTPIASGTSCRGRRPLPCPE
jgi:hypothetical protein